MRATRLGLTIGMLGALLLAPTANAAQSQVVITIDIVFGVSEEFTAYGDVDCSGQAVTDPIFFAGFGAKGRGAGTFHLIKTLTCADGPNAGDSFQIRVEAATTATGTIGGWAVVDGSGAFDNLRGAGSIVGTSNPSPGVDLQDVYTGRLTN